MSLDKEWWVQFGVLGGFGSAIGIGQTLLSSAELSWRLLLGKSLCSAGLGGSAALLGFFHAGATFELQVGAACALVTLGTDVLTKLLLKKLGADAPITLGNPHE